VSGRLLGLGTAAPEHSIAQADAAAIAATLASSPDEQARSIAALYRRSTVRRRGSVLLSNGLPGGVVTQTFFAPPRFAADRGPSTATRVDRYAGEAPPLGITAAARALGESGVQSHDLTHLVTVSCTGFAAPGLDASLIAGLGLSPTIQRTHVGFMGCHGAINGLRVAAAFANADPDARVLVCAVELCSLHFHYSSDPEQMVANALFADGAGATVVGGSGAGGAGGRGEAPVIAACGSKLFADSADAMTWRIGDFGFEMTLSPRVPDLLAEHLRPWLASFLSGHGLAIGDIASWAVHPGGPRIVSAVVDVLGLPSAAAEASREILAEHGNMSSPTVLFILERLRVQAGGRLRTPALALAFGPGLVAEAALLT
jgi:predicted naringenin-chalcone synthase